MTITKEMTFQEVIHDYPDTIRVFMRHGLGCIGCSAATYENVEQGARVHGVEIEELLRDLNEVVTAKK